jgi:hypothetical protein
MKKICLIILVTLLLAQSAYAASDKSPFQLTLVIPNKSIFIPIPGGIKDFHREPDFHVLLQNISDKPQALWDERGSRGHYNLTFEMVMDDKRISIERPPVVFKKNIYSNHAWEIKPGEYFIFNIYINNEAGEGNEWNFPKNNIRENKIVKLKAIYRNKLDEQSLPSESEPLDITIYWV